MKVTACPDCGIPADSNGGLLYHRSRCPLGIAQDSTDAADIAWFADHPGETQRSRPPADSEKLEWAMTGHAGFISLVTVTRSGSVTTRDFRVVGR